MSHPSSNIFVMHRSRFDEIDIHSLIFTQCFPHAQTLVGSCANECLPPTGACTVPANYIKGEGFVYWIPLEFDAAGNILPFAPFVNSFTLDLL